MSKSHSPSALDGQQLAQRNDIAVLARLHQYGHLRRIEIGRAVWAQSPEASGYSMAGRTLQRLKSRNYLMAKPNAIGSNSFVLTERGASRLSLEGIEARAGTELATAGSRFVHHSLGARYLIERAAAGSTVWSEADIDASRAPVGRGELKQRWGKVPDGFALSRSIPGAIDWVEVEGSKRSGNDTGRILGMSRGCGQPLGVSDRSVRIGQVFVVYDRRPSMGHEAALVAGLSRMRAGRDEQQMRVVLDALVFVRCDIKNPMTWQSFEEVPAATILALAKGPRKQRAKPAAAESSQPVRPSWEPIVAPEGASPEEIEKWERWEARLERAEAAEQKAAANQESDAREWLATPAGQAHLAALERKRREAQQQQEEQDAKDARMARRRREEQERKKAEAVPE
jgi:hypothetical protein